MADRGSGVPVRTRLPAGTVLAAQRGRAGTGPGCFVVRMNIGTSRTTGPRLTRDERVVQTVDTAAFRMAQPSVDPARHRAATVALRQVLQRLKEAPGLSVTDLTSTLPIKMPGLMKHLDVLSDAGLISRTKTGRTVSVSLTAEPMRQAAAWLLDYEDFDLRPPIIAG